MVMRRSDVISPQARSTLGPLAACLRVQWTNRGAALDRNTRATFHVGFPTADACFVITSSGASCQSVLAISPKVSVPQRGRAIARVLPLARRMRLLCRDGTIAWHLDA
jgi:hypothetical protein